MKSLRIQQPSLYFAARLLAFCGSLLFFLQAVLEFHQIAWGTGLWLGQYAFTWVVALFFFVVFCILCLVGIWMALWSGQRLEYILAWLAARRDRLGVVRWILAVIFAAVPIYFLQYTFWGLVLHGPYLRILLAGLAALLLGWMLTREAGRLIDWPGLLIGLLLISGGYTIFVSLKEVTSYPFSLGWSEGNRLWDYSILFGRRLYNYPADKYIPVLLDVGRRSIGGIPFLIPGIGIWAVRLWLALIDIVPYLILGWAAFRLDRKHAWLWLLAGVWAFTFVHQGPIHPPLLIAAILVALAWERPLWLAIPLIIAAGYFAEISRLTWMFAPGLWAALLEFGSPALQNNQFDRKVWARTIAAGLAGLFGGYAIPFLMPDLLQRIQSASGSAPSASAGAAISARVNATLTTQPLIWSRLLPNSTYDTGILIGLMLAILPLIVILIYLLRTGQWKLTRWQQLAIILLLLAFAVVGLIASVKIGGGADLHNMDMLLIGLMFVAALAWRSGASQWIEQRHWGPLWVRLTLVALVVLPGYNSLLSLTPLSVKGDIQTIATLADIVEDPLPNPLPDTLPSEADTAKALERLQREVAGAAKTGDVLFMDQRQLLTFGYVQPVPLVPEYDKKVLINEALSGNARYFERFYRDLASQRFALIVTSPVNKRLDKSEGNFGEENNAWVKWVTTPLLCYYESFDRLKRVGVELLIPRQDISGCEQTLPTNAVP